MKSNLHRDLSELITAGIITEDTAEQIRQYYSQREKDAPNRFLLVSGILGAILIGLGVILIIAHNWDQLSSGTKTAIAFAPLLIAQGLCGYTLLRKSTSVTWRETSATLLFFAIGASISLISQIYNIMGEIEGFLLTWMLLALPIIYVMRSSTVAIFYLMGITSYGMGVGYDRQDEGFNSYWLLLLALIPHYYLLNRDQPNSNFTIFFHLLIPGSITMLLGSLLSGNYIWGMPIYMSLFGVIYLWGHSSWIQQHRYTFNGYQLMGAIGIIVLLLSLSFHAFWKELLLEYQDSQQFFTGWDGLIFVGLILFGITLLVWQARMGQLSFKQPMKFVFLIFPFIFLIGLFNTAIASLAINLFTLLIGIYYIRWGTTENSLTLTNYGLLIISLLIICRFFDTNISFVVRGLLFIAIGVGFFLANYRLIQQRKSVS